MNFTTLSPDELLSHKENFLAAANNILLLQKEVDELQAQLDSVMDSTQKREFQQGHIVDYEKVLTLKRISDVLQPKRKALTKSINNLYWKLFPSDIFVDQHFFETFVSLKPDCAVRFSYETYGTEMKLEMESESQNA